MPTSPNPSAQPTTGTGSSSTGRGAEGVSLGARTAGFRATLCAFWIGPRCYAVDIGLVGEVVGVDRFLDVPLAPPGILGLFSLRGIPVALLDLTVVLELADRVSGRDGTPVSALVLSRPSGVIAAIVVDRVEGVVPEGRGVYTPREWAHEHPAVQGFVEVEFRRPVVVTVLDPIELTSRLNKLKYH